MDSNETDYRTRSKANQGGNFEADFLRFIVLLEFFYRFVSFTLKEVP